MKAFVQDDLIISITEEGNTEIGSMPKGVGLERLRFDGEKVILRGVNRARLIFCGNPILRPKR